MTDRLTRPNRVRSLDEDAYTVVGCKIFECKRQELLFKGCETLRERITFSRAFNTPIIWREIF